MSQTAQPSGTEAPAPISVKVFRGRRAGTSVNADKSFQWLTFVCSLLVPLVMVAIGLELLRSSWPALKQFGWRFFFSPEWDPVTQQFGAASSIYGTLVSTLIAMLIALPLSLAVALFLVELAPPRLSRVVGTLIELLAAVPSIIYGMWGLYVFAPFMAHCVQPWLGETLGFLPLFQGPPMGIGMLTAGIIMAFMVLPFVSAIARDVFQLVPNVVKESAFGLGATTWEVTCKVTIPYGLVGIIGAAFLGLGRALGETMAVTFVIGNAHKISPSLFSGANTIASTLANEFSEATEPLYVSSLMALGLVLYVITYLVQMLSQYLLRRMYRSWSVGL
jgi:phosphate transport system permease protein